ncbi:MAG: FAD-dependent oxidoreductase [Erysipelotrichales bacterium]|nr:FAD-dependent oxidoreductase [Erysipelotrichales bacterium]
MRYFVNNIRTNLKTSDADLKRLVLEKLAISDKELISLKLIRRAIDARNKKNISFINNFYVETNVSIQTSSDILLGELKEDIEVKRIGSPAKVVIVGFGPAGMFAGLILAKSGLKPIILERGCAVDERIEDLKLFEENSTFNKESNIVYGEGGAGTFSDGKLTTGIKSPYLRFVLKTLIEFGAPEDIYYDYTPHIGTDYLIKVVKNIRQEIIRLGGEIIFKAKFSNFEKQKNNFRVHYLKNSQEEVISADKIILATGHSAKDTIEMLYNKGLFVEPKNFAMGYRIEHLRKDIDYLQFGKEAYRLPPATYKLSTHLSNGRSVFTFCMCPGGELVMSASEENEFVINGMSYKNRDGRNSNSAILVNINVSDYYRNHPLDGFLFQKCIEKKAFKNYLLPVQLANDFLNDRKTAKLNKVIPSYSKGYYLAELKNFYPSFIAESIKEGLKDFNRKLPGFLNDDALLSGVETRSSSPVRLTRDENYQSSIAGIYPCGEGSGYAGGIMSSAIDGINTALKIIENFETQPKVADK